MRFLKNIYYTLYIAICLSFTFSINAQVVWWTPEVQNASAHLKKNIAHKIEKVDADINLLNYNPTLKINTQLDVDLSNYDLTQCEIFTVFVPSQLGQEELIWKLANTNQEHSDQLLFTNKRIADLTSNKFINFIGRDFTQAQIINYHHDKNGFLATQLSLQNIPTNRSIPVTAFEGSLAELIVFDRRVSPITRQIIESHLALKYNVPLADGLDYLNSRGETIWISGLDKYKDFSKVSALGRCDALHFYQKQSQSKIGKGYVGFSVGSLRSSNSENLNTIIDDTYFLWADNAAPLIFKKKHNNISELKRSWLLQSNAFESSENLEFTFAHKEIIEALKEKEFLWLAVNENDKNELNVPLFYKLNNGLNYQTASDIEVPNNESTAKIFKAPSLWAYVNNNEISCDQKSEKVMIVPVGGQEPYRIQIVGTDNTYKELYTVENKNDLLLLDMELGKYTIIVEDDENNSWNSEITINGELVQDLNLPNTLVLNDNKVIEIDAQIHQNNVVYNWTTPHQETYSTSNITIDQSGIYELEVSNGKCKAWHTIDVEAINNNIESMSVFPNPTASGYFQVSASMQLSAPYEIKITDGLGQLVSHDTFDEAQYILHKYRIEENGMYMISIISSSEVKTKKLLVVSK